jgi:hypothetical protein
MFAEGDRKREERKEAQIKSLDRSPPHADELEVVRGPSYAESLAE